jgi:hypothetical protein
MRMSFVKSNALTLSFLFTLYQYLCRMTLVTVWMIGLPIGLYMCYVVRPTYGPESIWYGLTAGMCFLAVLVLLQVASINWSTEVKRATLRAQAVRTGGIVSFGVPVVGGRGIGGIDFVSNRLMEELEDAENVALLVEEE